MTLTPASPLPLAERIPLPRSSERVALVMRTAKIHCAGGECLCVVRNLSGSGAGLRFFHAAPPDEAVELEMANGSRQEMHRVWQDDDQAGYRFAGPVEPSRLLDDPGASGRPEIRVTLDLPAKISVGDRDLRTRLLDLSQTGAQVEGQVALPVRHMIGLAIDGLPPRIGHVCWRKGSRHGLVFQQSLGLVELAQIVHAAGTRRNSTAMPLPFPRSPLAHCA